MKHLVKAFVRQPLSQMIVFALIIVLLVVAISLYVGRFSYFFPGPAIATAVLAFAILFTYRVLNTLTNQSAKQQNFVDDLQSKIKILEETLEERKANPSDLPPIQELELLVQRWRSFNLPVADNSIPIRQLLIVLSIVLRDTALGHRPRFEKSFAGTKPDRGAFLVQPGLSTDLPLVLKFDTKANIDLESTNYKVFVKGKIGNVPGEPHYPEQQYQRVSENQELGAIIYNFVGLNKRQDIKTLADFYQNHSNDEVQDVLQALFRAIKPWWADNTNWSPLRHRTRRDNLYEEYDRLLRNYDRIQEGVHLLGETITIPALRSLTADVRQITIDDSWMIYNPLYWLRQVFEQKRLGDWTNEPRYDSIVHGDFHTGNILVGERMNQPPAIWLIDFPKTHVGPTVQDIARLEADVKFSLLPLEKLELEKLERPPARVFDEIESRLLPATSIQPDDLGNLSLSLTSEGAAALAKAIAVITTLRKKAKGQHMIGDERLPYYLALLHATLPVLHYPDRTAWQKLYAFISAARLCELLSPISES